MLFGHGFILTTAYVTYIVIAVLFSILIRKLTGDLKDFASRNSPRVLLAGAAANLIAMFAIILLLVFWNRQSVMAFGLAFHRADVIAAIGGLTVTFLLAVGFVGLLKRTGHIDSVKAGLSVTSFTQTTSMLLGLAVLLTVVLQEEVLNRGYVTLNLLRLGPWAIILTSIALFVLILFLTNRANLNQVVSRVVSALILIISYLLTQWIDLGAGDIALCDGCSQCNDIQYYRAILIFYDLARAQRRPTNRFPDYLRLGDYRFTDFYGMNFHFQGLGQ
jgi:hypothetical protein